MKNQRLSRNIFRVTIIITILFVGSTFITSEIPNEEVYNGNAEIFPSLGPNFMPFYNFTLRAPGNSTAMNFFVDEEGYIYIAGAHTSYPITTPGHLNDTIAGKQDILLVKVNPDGKSVNYSTLIGGLENDYAKDITLDSDGNIYIVGYTYSPDFPTTPGAYNETYWESSDVFVCKINNNATTLLASTLISGDASDNGLAIILDVDENPIIAGETKYSDAGFYPTTTGSHDQGHNGVWDMFITKLDKDLTTLNFSTFIGGSADDTINDLAIDSQGNICFVGYTSSTNYPTTPGAYNASMDSYYSVVAGKLSANGSQLLNSTHVGPGFHGEGIAIDTNDNIYLTGSAEENFPISPGAAQSTPMGAADAFVCKFDNNLSALEYSTLITGNNDPFGWDIKVDSDGNAYVIGNMGPELNATPAAVNKTFYGSTSYNAFFCKINNDGTKFLYCTYLGVGLSGYSLHLTANNRIYALYYGDPGLTTTPGAIDARDRGACVTMTVPLLDDDADFIPDEDELSFYGTNATNNDTDDDGYSDSEEIDMGADPVDPNDPVPDLQPDVSIVADNITAVTGESIQFNVSGNLGDEPADFTWNFNDSWVLFSRDPIHSFSNPGTYNVTVTVTDNDGDQDTANISITILQNFVPSIIITANTTSIEEGEWIQFNVTGSLGDKPSTFTWNFGDLTGSNLENVSHQFNSSGNYTVTLWVYDAHLDSDQDTMLITVRSKGDGNGDTDPDGDPNENPQVPGYSTPLLIFFTSVMATIIVQRDVKKARTRRIIL